MCRLFRGAGLKVLGLNCETTQWSWWSSPVWFRRDLYDSRPRGSGFQSNSSSGPRFPPRGARFPQLGHGMFGVFPNTFLGQMSQH
jgi:hypothetical protein